MLDVYFFSIVRCDKNANCHSGHDGCIVSFIRLYLRLQGQVGCLGLIVHPLSYWMERGIQDFMIALLNPLFIKIA